MTEIAASPPPPCVILNEPQLAVNIGAVARVMANFGLYDLRLVRPRDGWPQEAAWPSASGADWPLNDAKVFDTLEAAVADLQLLYATTARPREVRVPIITPREAATNLRAASLQGQGIGILFGGERAGLETHDIALCQAIVTIPIDPKFRSLNLAQAVAINAYEWRTGLEDAPPPAFGEADPPADQAMMLGLFEHLEGDLDAAGFFHPVEKRPSMTRNLRAVFSRARPTEQEVRTFRGVITALSKGRGRVLEKLAKKKEAGEG
jgi:tRNA/rRNA methyltransferase